MRQINEAPWEKTDLSESGKVTNTAPRIRDAAFAVELAVKFVALAKMTGVSVISADFHNDQLTFQRCGWLFRDFGSRVDFTGAYELAFPHELGATTSVPDLCIRCGNYDGTRDCEAFAKAEDKLSYLLQDQHVEVKSVFVRRSEVPAIDALLTRLDEMVQQGVSFQKSSGSDMESDTQLHQIRLYAYPGGIEWELAYPPATYHNQQLKSWCVDWYQSCRMIPETAKIPPDGSVKIGHLLSLSERIAGADSGGGSEKGVR